MLRLNIYYYVRDVLSIPIDIDNIRLTNCELQTEIDDDEHSITADVELKNVDQNVAGKIEVALERIEPGSRAPKFTCSQIRSIEEQIPDMGINAFNCMPMKNRDLEKGDFQSLSYGNLLGLGYWELYWFISFMLIFNGISCSVIRLIILCLFRLLLIKQKIIKFS